MTSPDGVAVDPVGDVFVADGTNHTNSRVLELPQGASTPVSLPFSGLIAPTGLAVDQAGDVFVADQGNNRVLELPHGASKQVVLPFGQINQPEALAVDQAGDVYMAQATSNQVLELVHGAPAPVVVGTFQEPPFGLAVDQAGDLFASQNGRGDPASNTVVELANGASKPTTLPFTGLDSPTGVAVDQAGDVFVSDNGNWRVLELPHGANKQIVLPFPGSSSFGLPTGLAVASNGDVFAADNSFDDVAELPAQLSVTSPAPDAIVGTAYQFTPQVMGGAVPLQWTITSGQLPPGLKLNSSTGAITGTPTQKGSSTVTLQLTDSGQPQLSAYPSYSISVGAGTPAATPQPSSLDFGTQTVFWSYPAKAVSLSNTGNAPLNVSAVGLIGTNASDFAVDSDACSGHSLPAGASCQVLVRFVPGYTTGLGAKSATLQFSDNAANSPQSVALSGISQLYVSPGQQPAFSMAPDRLDFADTAPGGHSKTQRFTVTNPGNEPMNISNVSLTGKAPHQFKLLSGTCRGASVAPSASCLIYVQFRPTAFGHQNALVQIDDNAPGSPHIAQVTGTAVGAEAVLSPTHLAFGNQRVDEASKPRTIQVTNAGNRALQLRKAAIQGPNAKSFKIDSDTCSGKTIRAGAGCSLDLSFRPTARGAATASLKLADDGIGGTGSVTLSGQGIAPTANLSPVGIVFGSVPVGAHSAGHTLTLTNRGDAALHIDQVLLQGIDPRAFSIVFDRCRGRILRPMASCQVVIAFGPKRVGTANARLAFRDDAVSRTQRVGLRGWGTAG